jgi:hypothetical protein
MKSPGPRRLCLVCATWLCGALTFPNITRATLFEYDPFDYSGTSLLGQNGGTGWNGAWFNTASTPNGLSNDGISLSYPMSWESPLAPLPASGSRVVTGGVGASSSRLLSQTINLGVDGTVAYVSALFEKNAPDGGGVSTDNVLLEFVDSLGNRRWGVGIEGTGDKPWLNANGSGTPSTGPAVTPEATYFMVAKIVSSASGSDTAYLKVYGPGYSSEVTAAEPTTWDVTLLETTSAVLDRVRVRIDAGNTVSTPGEVDEIRIGDSWLDVVSVPEPSSLTLLSLALVGGILWKRRM